MKAIENAGGAKGGQRWRRFCSGMLPLFFSLLTVFAAGGCASRIVSGLQSELATTLEQETDIALLREGLPSLLLVWETFRRSEESPSRETLLEGIRAHLAYAMLLEETNQRQRARLAYDRAREFAQALLAGYPAFNTVRRDPVSLARMTAAFGPKDVPTLFWAAQAWGGAIRAAEGDPASLVDLPLVLALVERLLLLDEAYYHGGPHLFLGVYHSSRPSALGGDPERGRVHFERALALSGRRFLQVQLHFAAGYARMVQDKKLFRDLLEEILARPVVRGEEAAAANRLAQLQAERLLTQIDDFFERTGQ